MRKLKCKLYRVKKGYWLGLWIWRTVESCAYYHRVRMVHVGCPKQYSRVRPLWSLVCPTISTFPHTPTCTHLPPPPKCLAKIPNYLALSCHHGWSCGQNGWAMSITLVQCSILIRSQIGGLATSPMGSFLCLIFLSLASCNAQRNFKEFPVSGPHPPLPFKKILKEKK